MTRSSFTSAPYFASGSVRPGVVCALAAALWLCAAGDALAGDALAGDALAGEPTRHPMRVSITFGEPVKVANVTLFEAPDPRVAAISPDDSLIAVACQTKTGPQIALFRIADGGEVQGEPVTVSPSLPLSLKDFDHYVIALAFHTDKPLLYVWRDVRGPRKDHPPVDVIYNEFDHLLVYRIDDGTLTLVKQACRGQDYAFGVQMGGLGVDPANNRLYVPNTQQKHPDPKQEGVWCERVGFIDQDDAGLPVCTAGANGDAARLTMMSLFLRYDGCYRLDPTLYQNFPLGQCGPFPVAGKTVIFVDKHDLLTLDTGATSVQADGRPGSSWYPLLEIGGASWCRCAIHPKLPVIYVTAHNRTFAIQHVDGFPTLMPQVISTNEAIMTAPVVMTRSGKIAGGGAYAVYLLQLDASGFLTGAAEKIAAGPDYVRAIVYSEKHDKLFVAVSKLPAPPDK